MLPPSSKNKQHKLKRQTNRLLINALTTSFSYKIIYKRVYMYNMLLLIFIYIIYVIWRHLMLFWCTKEAQFPVHILGGYQQLVFHMNIVCVIFVFVFCSKSLLKFSSLQYINTYTSIHDGGRVSHRYICLPRPQNSKSPKKFCVVAAFPEHG